MEKKSIPDYIARNKKYISRRKFVIKIDPATFVHPASVQHGNVSVGAYSSLWPCSVIRGDFAPVSVGKFTSIQDGCMVHTGSVGDFVTVAHGAVIHACAVENNCMIGINTVIQDFATIGEGTIVAAGAVVLEKQVIPPNSLVMGVPGKVRKGFPGQMEKITNNALYYAALAQLYKENKDVTSIDAINEKAMELLKWLEENEEKK
jgi:carbonic anhydrase/acetyltransferase-like protein (isoleucine patch superfamily)